MHIVIELSTCGALGSDGPVQENCTKTYNNTEAMKSVRVSSQNPYKGVQVWKVPNENYYT